MAATKASLWRKWQRSMGTISPRDLAEARSWFDNLWRAGFYGMGVPVARPLSYDELQVYDMAAREGRRPTNLKPR